MRSKPYVTILALVTVFVLSACAGQARVTYIPDGGAYTVEDLSGALAESDPGSAARVKAEDALAARQEALADLRTHGDDAARLADTLTSEFPTDSTAVPYSVEVATFDGEPAWIVFEAWGDAGEALDSRRVWVFARDDLSILAADSDR